MCSSDLLAMKTGRGPEKNTVLAEISDSGVGIPPEKLEQIFTPFYTDKNRGTGLGLTIAKSIVDKHKGRISVASTPGEGSVFTVLLPVNAEESA